MGQLNAPIYFTLREVPNLPQHSVVMGNASYCSVQVNKKPAAVTLKQDTIKWLTKCNVAFEENMLNVELPELVKKVPN